MTTPKYDKSEWARGEWDNEPDRVDFIHAGFSCFILRNTMGNWCGYVGIPKEHSLFGIDYNNFDVMPDLDVHGGLTYSDLCSGHICHTPEEGMPDEVWWLGFDTGHYMDLSPSMLEHYPELYGRDEKTTYKNMDYVTSETKKLADQLRSIEKEK